MVPLDTQWLPVITNLTWKICGLLWWASEDGWRDVVHVTPEHKVGAQLLELDLQHACAEGRDPR